MSAYRAAWTSGWLLREAATCSSAVELAKRLNVSSDALINGLARLRAEGLEIPTVRELLGKVPPGPRVTEREDPTPGVEFSRSTLPSGKYPSEAANDGDWDDKTNPDGVQFSDEGSNPHEGEAGVNVRAKEPGASTEDCSGSDIGKADKSGMPVHMEMDVPEGFRVKGTSTYYDANGAVIGQWVKTNRLEEDRLKAFTEAIKSIAEPFRAAADPVPAPGHTSADILNVIPMGDPHIGMYSWATETGQDFDLDIAESNLVTAVDHLIGLAPPADECLIISLGDFYHSDSGAGTTTKGTRVDVDSRWAKVLSVGIRVMRRCIDQALTKHRTVRIICELGNHDDNSSIMLALCLANYYEREPRVIVDTSPAKYHWHRFGDCLIGTTHGDTVKASALGAVMACDRAKDWGETTHRAWYCGHVHHDTMKEYPGVTVETFRTLAPSDAWHKGQGYRSGQDLKLDVWHRRHGRINRHSIGIRQIWDLQGEAA